MGRPHFGVDEAREPLAVQQGDQAVDHGVARAADQHAGQRQLDGRGQALARSGAL